MSVRSFLDTNVLVYTDDGDAPEKQAKAQEIVERCRSERTGVVSTQILQEYFVTATRKLRVPPEAAKRSWRSSAVSTYSRSHLRTSLPRSTFIDSTSSPFGML
jgi:predicted nucleic acid-binding protein